MNGEQSVYIEELFEDSRTSTPFGLLGQEYIGSTLGDENNTVSLNELLVYSKDNFAHARCMVDEKWVYAYNGKLLVIKAKVPREEQNPNKPTLLHNKHVPNMPITREIFAKFGRP